MAKYVDMHCDTLLHAFISGEDTVYEMPQAMVDVKRLKQSGVLAQCFAVFFPPRQAPKAKPGEFQLPQIPDDITFFQKEREILLNTIEQYPDQIALAKNSTELSQNEASGKVSAILTIEDSRAVDEKIERVGWFYEQGVRMMSLTWNHANCIGYPNTWDTDQMNLGLTDFGKEAVEEMNRLGILVDVSHLSDGGFYDVASLVEGPFVASHSNCRTLTNHPRNLTDDMIKVLASHGGIAGLNFCPEFVDEPGATKTSIKQLADHVQHLLRIGGEDIIAIGTDFDGIEGELEIGEPGKMELLFHELKHRGLTERQIDKLVSDNFRRVFEIVVK